MPALDHVGHHTTLTLVFVAYKALLLVVAFGSLVGPTYDSSSSLLALDAGPRNLAARLASWDAIYFVKAAERGYVFEQEWAFGSALPACISFLARRE